MKYIAISGTVAAGKTTLLNALKQSLDGRCAAHEERPQDNPFISESYSDAGRWSFHSQVRFLAQYFDEREWAEGAFDFYFYDRCLIENLVLARHRAEQGFLNEDEMQTLEKLAHGIERLMPAVDCYIYLKCSPELLAAHIHTRDRDYERAIDMDQVIGLKRLYDAWAESLPKERTLIIDADKGIDAEAVLRFIGA